MLSLLLSTVVLGIAGIDLFGAALVASGIAAGLSRSRIVLFTACAFVFTVLTGVFFSYAGTGVFSSIRSAIPDSDSSFWAFLNTAIIAVICIWLFRKARPSKTKKPQKSLSNSAWTTALVGIAFGVGAILDPTYVAVISLAGQNGNLLTIVVLCITWTLISQVLLFGLFAAYLLRKHEAALAWCSRMWSQHKHLLQRVVFGAAVLSVLILAADTATFFATGNYLLF